MTDPRRFLTEAEDILGRQAASLDGVWPRASAVMARRSLEAALDQFWQREYPHVASASRSTQLACLDRFMRDQTLAQDVRVAWMGLSRACHHHAYELPPTVAELRVWIDQVGTLISRLEQAAAADRTL